MQGSVSGGGVGARAGGVESKVARVCWLAAGVWLAAGNADTGGVCGAYRQCAVRRASSETVCRAVRARVRALESDDGGRK